MSHVKKGDTVRQILPAPIVGKVERFEVCQESGDVQVKVVWPDANGDGEDESRYFKVDEVELVNE